MKRGENERQYIIESRIQIAFPFPYDYFGCLIYMFFYLN